MTKNKLLLLIFFIASFGEAFAYIAKPENRPNLYIEENVPQSYLLNNSIKPTNAVFNLVTHGMPGALHINGQWLAGKSLVNKIKELIPSRTKHVNIYGCNFGKGQIGLNAVSQIEKALNVTIAASNNITGKEGDWVLEIGSPINQIVAENYNFNLQTCAGTVGGTDPGDDFDGDGVCNSLDYDDDNDGIIDTDECDFVFVCNTLTTITFPNTGTLVTAGDATTSVGAVYRFSSVGTILGTTTVIDALIEFVESSSTTNVSVSDMDRVDEGGNDEWSPGIENTSTDLSTFEWAKFKISFVLTGTTTAAPVFDFMLINYDIDGGSDFTETVGYELPNSVITDQNTDLTYEGSIDDFEVYSGVYQDFYPNDFDIEATVGALYLDKNEVFVKYGNTGGPSSSPNSRTALFSGDCSKISSVFTDPVSSDCDVDKDGYDNQYDVDSDADGCPDAIENTGTFTFNDLDSDYSLSASIDSNSSSATYGVPNGTSYAVGSTQNNAIQADECDACNSTSSLYVDSDKDGIGDYCDLDDDNDGILDTEECPIYDSDLTGPLSFNVDLESTDDTSPLVAHNLKSITISANGETYYNFIQPSNFTSNYTNVTIPDEIAAVENGVFPFDYSDSNYDTKMLSALRSYNLNYYQQLDENDLRTSNYKLEFSTPVISKAHMYVMVAERLGNNYQKVTAKDQLGNVLGTLEINSGDYTDLGFPSHPTSPINTMFMAIYPIDDIAPVGSAIYELVVSFDTTILNDGPDGKIFFFGNELYNECDYDGDGIPNNKDLDSDNDGCPDALENSGTYTFSDLDSEYRLLASVDSNSSSFTYGVPNSTAYSVGSSQDVATQSEYCSSCHADNPNFVDSDGDDIGDDCDLDDDNDGILDTMECSYVTNFGANDLIITNEIISTIVSSDPNGTVSVVNGLGSNGESGLKFEDTGSGISYININSWTGDQSSAIGSQLKFNILAIDNGGTWLDSNNVDSDIKLYSGGTVISADLQGYPYGLTEPTDLSEAFPQSIALTAANFNTTVAEFNTIMSNLDSIQIRVEFFNEVLGEEAYFFTPNVTINDVCDFDGDGVPDHLDLDSDNDGCPDALEANSNLNYDDLDSNLSLDGTVDTDSTSDTYGLPTLAGIGKPIGSSQDGSTQAEVCSICNSDNPNFVDSDSDGVGDYCDYDDDNDGILDIDEVDEYLRSFQGDDSKTAYISYEFPGMSPDYYHMQNWFLTGVSDMTTHGTITTSTPGSNLRVENITAETFAEAKANGDYIEMSFTTQENLIDPFITRIHTEWMKVNDQDYFDATAEVYEDNVLIAQSQVKDIEPGTQNFTSGGRNFYYILPFANRIALQDNKTYTIRIYVSGLQEDSSTETYSFLDDVTIGFSGALEKNTDTDTIPNHLDTDSDGDTCPDALENEGAYDTSDLDSNNRIDISTYPIDSDSTSETYGVPDSTGYGIGTAFDNTQLSDACLAEVTISDASVTEGGDLVFTITHSKAWYFNSDYTLTYTNNTASSADYTALTSTVRVNLGTTSQTITIPTVDDAILENTEDFTLEITPTGNGYGLKLIDAEATGTIYDDESVGVDEGIRAVDFIVVEADTTEDFEITYDGPTLPGSFTVDYVITNGTATSGLDYSVVASGNVSFASGETSQTVTVTILEDALLEGNETLNITLSNISNASVNMIDDTGVGTITDDESVGVDEGIRAVDFIVVEADTTEDFEITYDGPTLPGSFTVDYVITNGTATSGLDYSVVASGNVSFASGETSQTVTVTILEDALLEGNETLNITLSNISNASVNMIDDTGVGTITDDESVGVDEGIRAVDFIVVEADTTEDFEITYDGPTLPGSFTVDYVITNGTATSGLDYSVVASGNVSFASGETSQTVTVTILEDALLEGNETLNITLSNISNASVNMIDDTGVGTITDDESVGVDEGIRAVDFIVVEADTTEDFEITYDGPTLPGSFTVDYVITNGTATSGLDYSVVASGNVSFASGETSQTVTVTILEDALLEGNETLNITLSNISNASVNMIDDTGVGTITDDDGGVGTGIYFDATDVDVNESDGTATFIVRLLGDVEGGFTINYASTNNSATAGLDYTIVSGQLTFNGTNNEYYEIVVPIIDDTLIESKEYYFINLSDISNVNVIINTPQAIGGIIDNDFEIDLDTDDDGILDTVEDLNNDGDNDPSTNPTDTDLDGRPDYLDIDSDNDGIPDNVEAQSTAGYIAPSLIDENNNGVDDIYEFGIQIGIDPVNTDDGDNPDYLDLDSDNDGVPDSIEGHDQNHDGIADILLSGVDTDDDGLDDNFEGSNLNDIDVNDEIDDPINDLPNTDADDESDYRDLDDDNDGIPTEEEDTDDDSDYSNDDWDNDGIPDYLDPDVKPKYELEVYNVVTPNDDGRHDVFIIKNIEYYPNNTVQIYNRWGVLVFETEGYHNKDNNFDGYSRARATVNNGKKLPTGTYYYLLSYEDKDGAMKKLTNYLYLN